ncbi:MAG: hypothetical protein U1F33_00065 [Alphaproteobacteria bacterium]
MRKLDRRPTRRHYLRSFAVAAVLVAIALGAGVLGYHYLDGLRWVDALVDAAMILGGMGPVNPLVNDGAKIFAATYALFCGLVFLASAAVLLAPWIHLLLHRLHVDEE